MNKGNFYAGLAVMVGLMVLGIMIPVAVKEYRSFDRTVVVKGLCELLIRLCQMMFSLSMI